ncbi:MAG: cytochrome c maturation protein CcmE [Planktomarina sp.]
MRGLKKQRRIQIIALAMVCLAGATALVGYALRDGISLFRSPAQVIAAPPTATEVFRIGGLVVEDSITPLQGVSFEFAVTDGGATVPVRYVGTDLPPDLFEEGQGTVATGTYVDGVFLATELLAKHDETYMPAEVVDALKEQGVYQDPNS